MWMEALGMLAHMLATFPSRGTSRWVPWCQLFQAGTLGCFKHAEEKKHVMSVCNTSVTDKSKTWYFSREFKMKMCTLFLWSWVFLISQAQKAMRRTKLLHDQQEKIKDLILLTVNVTEILCSYDGDVYIWNVSVTRTEFFDRFISPIRSPLHQSTVKLLL